MKFCVVSIKTQTSTFRNPEFQNFHKTYELPPPTTIIGFAGAALGLSPRATQAYFDKDNLWIGTYGTSQGLAKDLWKYRTFDTKNPSSILKKEILFNNHFIIVYGSDNYNKVNEIQEAFLNPTYALSLGNNDSLAKIISCEVLAETCKSRDIENCLVAGNIIGEVLDNIKNGLDFSMFSTSEPITFDLPTRFKYETDYGLRKIISRQEISIVGEKFRLNVEKEGISYEGRFIPIFPISPK